MIVKTENLSREFVRGKNQFYAVDHVNLEVEEKELVAIMGQSGSGKSTLINETLQPILSQKFYRSLQDPPSSIC